MSRAAHNRYTVRLMLILEAAAWVILALVSALAPQSGVAADAGRARAWKFAPTKQRETIDRV